MPLKDDWVNGNSFTHADQNDVAAAVNTTSDALPADYVVTVDGSTYTATPRGESGLTGYSGADFTTVMQAAVDALTSDAPGVDGTFPNSWGEGGGKIHICRGEYTLGDEIVVTGWEAISSGSARPRSQLIIEGAGHSTRLTQNTSGKNAFVVKNNANVSVLNMWGFVGASAKSFILGDSDGADDEISFWDSTLDGLFIESASTTAAPVHLKNFFDLSVPKLQISASSFDALILENDSTTNNYGNSHFGFVRATGVGHKGLVLRSTDTTEFGHFINLLTFDNFQSNGSDTGIYALGAWFVDFQSVDIEAATTCVHFDSTDVSHKVTRFVSVFDGYLLPSSAGTAIKGSLGAGGNSVRSWVEMSAGSGTVIIDDPSLFQPRSTYNLQTNGAAEIATASIASSKHRVYISGNDDVVRDSQRNLISGTVATIQAGTGTPEGAVTAPVGTLFLRTDGGASTTLYVKQSGAGNTGWAAK